MAIPFAAPIDLQKNELQNATLQNLGSDPASPVEGQAYHNTGDHHPRVHDGTSFKTVPFATSATPTPEAVASTASVGTSADAARADHRHAMPGLATSGADGFMPATDKAKLDNAVSAATASRLVIRDASGRAQFADPAAAADAATMGWVQAQLQGLDPKASVLVATTAALAVTGRTATTLTIGGTSIAIDGITLANNDRVLVKDSTTGTGAGAWDNGIYTVGGVGSSIVLTRATDMDAWAEVPGAYVAVERGTTNDDTVWLSTADQGGTLGTTAITWSAFPVSLAPGSVANSSLANMAQATIKGRAAGAGTGAPQDLSAAQVLAIIGLAGKAAATIGNASATTITVTHNLGTTDVQVQVWELTGSLRQVYVETQIVDANNVKFLFATAPATNSLRVVVMG